MNLKAFAQFLQLDYFFLLLVRVFIGSGYKSVISHMVHKYGLLVLCIFTFILISFEA